MFRIFCLFLILRDNFYNYISIKIISIKMTKMQNLKIKLEYQCQKTADASNTKLYQFLLHNYYKNPKLQYYKVDQNCYQDLQ